MCSVAMLHLWFKKHKMCYWNRGWPANGEGSDTFIAESTNTLQNDFFIASSKVVRPYLLSFLMLCKWITGLVNLY